MAERTRSIASPERLIAERTAVPEAFRGTGAGLVERLVADTRTQRFRTNGAAAGPDRSGRTGEALDQVRGARAVVQSKRMAL